MPTQPIEPTSPLGRLIASTVPSEDRNAAMESAKQHGLLTKEEGEAIEARKRAETEARKAQAAASLAQPDQPLRTITDVLRYAEKVVVTNSSTPNAYIAILAKELLVAHQKINELTAVLGAVDTALLKTRGDIRRLIGNN